VLLWRGAGEENSDEQIEGRGYQKAVMKNLSQNFLRENLAQNERLLFLILKFHYPFARTLYNHKGDVRVCGI